MIVSLYRTLGIILHTVRADYDCVWWVFLLYQVLNRTFRSSALPYPKHGCRPLRGALVNMYIYKRSFFFSGIRSGVFFSSRPKYGIRGTGILGQIASFERRLRGAAPTPLATGILGRIASFERRLRGAAPTPLALPCPFRKSTWTWTDAERDKQEVAKISHAEKDFRRFRVYLNVCSAWMIYKIGIISKR